MDGHKLIVSVAWARRSLKNSYLCGSLDDDKEPSLMTKASDETDKLHIWSSSEQV